MDFHHLHIHSHYSLMWGVTPIDVLAQTLRDQGQTVFPLTDRNGVYGLIEHLKVCAEYELRPIVGCEIVTAGEQALCLVKTRDGYHNLNALLTGFNRDPRWRLAQALPAYHEGLIIITQTETLLEAGYPDADLYIDLSPGRIDQARKLKARWNLPWVVTSHAYMIQPRAYERHQLLRAIDTNAKLSRIAPDQLVAPDDRLFTRAEMEARFAAYPDALQATRDITEACQFAPEIGKLTFPPSEFDHAYKTLRDKTFAGLVKRYGRITDTIRKRADRELDMIRRKSFSNCFLVIEDVVSRFPLTCGRGSAAASIVSYALGITHVDPLAHNLFFERFLNPGRIDPPDIDVDFAWDERDQVRDYLWDKYGGEHIAMVCNHNRFRMRSAVREIAKVYGLGEREMSSAAHLLARSRRLEDKPDLPEPWPHILRMAKSLEDHPRHISVHCGGVVITPDPITHHCPLRPMPIGYDVVPWDKDGVEDYGLVKLDFLGNRSLAVIRDTLHSVGENYGVHIDYASLNPVSDPKAQQLIESGDTMGCFYIESPATRLLLRKIGMGDFETLVAVSSIIRPAANTVSDEWVRRRRHVMAGKTPNWRVLDARMEHILEETHGLMVYQEDVTKTAMAVAGFDAIEGDQLRKIVSKKHKQKALADMRRRFFDGCRDNGVADADIEDIWTMIQSFAHYSFCKPHSASYAMVSYKSAWLKFHYPAEFMAAVISNRGGFYSAFAYLSHAKRMGLKILAPDINRSRIPFHGRDGVIHIGFSQIKGLRQDTMTAIVSERENAPFMDLTDFMHRVHPTPEETKRLILAGCFDTLEPDNRPTLIWRALHWYAQHQRQGEDLFPNYVKVEDLPKMEPYSLGVKLQLERKLFGFWVSRHPLERYDLRAIQRTYNRELPHLIGRRITLVGWLITHKTVTTKQGEPMAFLTFEDETGLCETVLFPELYKQRAMLLDYTKSFILKGEVVSDLGAVTLTLTDLQRLRAQPRPTRLKSEAIGV